MTNKTVIEKPWGREEVIEINDKFMVKRLTMWAGHRCSLQYHNVKKETVYVLSGVLKILQGSSVDSLEESCSLLATHSPFHPALSTEWRRSRMPCT